MEKNPAYEGHDPEPIYEQIREPDPGVQRVGRPFVTRLKCCGCSLKRKTVSKEHTQTQTYTEIFRLIKQYLVLCYIVGIHR